MAYLVDHTPAASVKQKSFNGIRRTKDGMLYLTSVNPNKGNETIEVSNEPVIQIVENDSERTSNKVISPQIQSISEITPLLPIEMEVNAPAIVECVVYPDEVSVVEATAIDITTITSCGWGCHGGCGYVSECYITKIEEVEIEEEESLLSEQIFVDPYIFEAKASRKPCENLAKTSRKPRENLPKLTKKFTVNFTRGRFATNPFIGYKI